MPAIKEQVDKEKLSDHVIFVGVTSNVKEYMDAMDLFLLPSLYEGLPCVCIEVQANGLPCIVSEYVTKETALSDAMQFVKIDHASEWVEKILTDDLDALRNQRMKMPWKDLKNYDILTQVKELEKKYLSYTID